MPCYSQRIVSVELANRNLDTLKKAMEDMGFSVRLVGSQFNFSGQHKETGVYDSGSYDGRQLKHNGTIDIAEVKRSYAAQEVVKQFGSIAKITKLSGTRFRVQMRA